MKIFFIGDIHHPNAKNWIHGLEKFGNCEVIPFSLYFKAGLTGKIIRTFHWLWSILFLKYKIKNSGADIVLGYRVPSNGFLAATTGLHPLVIASQGRCDIWPPNGKSANFKRKLARYALTRADLVQAWAPHMADCLFTMGATINKTLILPRGIDLNIFKFANKDFQTLNIITTRSLEPEYRHIIILEALVKLKELNIPFNYTIVGNGSLMNNLTEFCEINNISDSVKFLGRIDNHILPTMLSESNCYVAMPLTEGVSASLFEAMACGCYPIVSDLDANQSWIENDVNGNLIPIDNVNLLANAFVDVYNNKAKAIEVISNNRRLVEEKGNLETNMKLFVTTYKNLINK